MKPETVRSALFVLTLFACGLGGAYLARRTTPTEIVTVQAEQSQSAEISKLQAQLRAATAQIETLKRHTRTARTSITRPDGTKETTETTDTHVDRVTDTRTDQAVAVVEDTAKASETAKSTVRIETTPRPRWRLGALVGVQLKPLDLPPQWVAGATLERRIADSPISVGGWATLTRDGDVAAGVSASIEF